MDEIIKSAEAADQNVKLAKALRKTLKKKPSPAFHVIYNPVGAMAAPYFLRSPS
jgi:hypothetical protein